MPLMTKKQALERILDHFVDINYGSLTTLESRVLKILEYAGIDWHISNGDIKKGKKKK